MLIFVLHSMKRSKVSYKTETYIGLAPAPHLGMQHVTSLCDLHIKVSHIESISAPLNRVFISVKFHFVLKCC